MHNALLATMSFSLTTGWHGTAALLSSLPSLNNVPGVSGTVSFALLCLCGALSSFFGAATFRAFGFSKITVVNNAVNGLVILSSLAFPTPLTQYGSTALMGLCVGGAVVAQQSCERPSLRLLLACASCTPANFRCACHVDADVTWLSVQYAEASGMPPASSVGLFNGMLQGFTATSCAYELA